MSSSIDKALGLLGNKVSDGPVQAVQHKPEKVLSKKQIAERDRKAAEEKKRKKAAAMIMAMNGGASGAPAGKKKADARWEGGKEGKPVPASIPVKNLVKLTAERVTALVASGEGAPFAPAGRTFREWVQVTHDDHDRWHRHDIGDLDLHIPGQLRRHRVRGGDVLPLRRRRPAGDEPDGEPLHPRLQRDRGLDRVVPDRER